MEHNPYIDLNDGTAITYSDIKVDGNVENITIYFETPTENGFNSMQIDYPNGFTSHRFDHISADFAVVSRVRITLQSRKRASI